MTQPAAAECDSEAHQRIFRESDECSLSHAFSSTTNAGMNINWPPQEAVHYRAAENTEAFHRTELDFQFQSKTPTQFLQFIDRYQMMKWHRSPHFLRIIIGKRGSFISFIFCFTFVFWFWLQFLLPSRCPQEKKGN